MRDPVERVLDALRDRGKQPTQKGESWLCRCPAHDDSTPSLSIGRGKDGRALVKCFANCDTKDVLSAIGLKMPDLMPEAQGKNGPQIVAQYDYRDENEMLLYQVVRYAPKTFRQRRPDKSARDGWQWKLEGVRRVPYRLPEILRASLDAIVYVVEGEKDADTLAALGLVATTNAGGAGKWHTLDRDTMTKAFRGRSVVILPDNDEAGAKHGQQVAKELHGIAAHVRIINLPELRPKGDVSDWFADDHTMLELQELVTASSAQSKTGTGDERPNQAPNPLITGAMTNAELDACEIVHDWIIEDVLVANEPMTGAGPSKGMKTAIIVEAAISIASGTPFLGRYRVPKPRTVYIISAESGIASLKARMRQVCKAKGIDPKTLPIHWYTRVETLTTLEGQQHLQEALQHFGATVCILDPAYLLIGGEVTADGAGNMFTMGALLASVNAACAAAGATCCILTHANGRVVNGEPMELTHIAWSGFQQWARQWWLISRREKYTDDGRHALYLRFGGSAGHTGLLSIDINEGTNATGRRWELAVRDSAEERQAEAEAKNREALEQLIADCDLVLKTLTRAIHGKTDVATFNAIYERVDISKNRVRAALTKLVGDGAVEEANGTIENGTATKPATGYRRPLAWAA